MSDFWKEFDALCQSVRAKGDNDLYSALKEARRYVNGLTDGWYDFLSELETTIREYKLSSSDEELAQNVIKTLKTFLEG